MTSVYDRMVINEKAAEALITPDKQAPTNEKGPDKP